MKVSYLFLTNEKVPRIDKNAFDNWCKCKSELLSTLYQFLTTSNETEKKLIDFLNVTNSILKLFQHQQVFFLVLM